MMSEHPRHEQVVTATVVVEANTDPQSVPLNMYEAGDAMVVVAPLPAVMPSDVTVAVAQGELAITAHLRSAAPKDYVMHEWRYGGYQRVVPLPGGFGAQAEATLANGQLAIRLLRGDATEAYTIHPTAP